MEGIMKRVISLLLLTIAAVSLQAQDFDLYFANNVGDVTSLRNIKTDPNLKWKKVEGSSVSSNRVDVENVVNMFKQTRMKKLDDQKLFWKMRDDNLLCFRINDGKGKSGEYEARLRIGQRTVVKNISGYFFVNTENNTDSLYVSVCRKGCGPNDTLRFTYYVNDWDNEGLLVFKLDNKRQRSGLTYELEYRLKGEGEKTGGFRRLPLTGTSFQSFYVPADSAINDLFFLSEGNRLKVDLARLTWGANLSNRLNRLWIGTNFTLDKHENRELTIFNMLGSGLFEQYDTLYLQVLGKNGKPIQAVVDPQTKLAKGFVFNIAQVDEQGKYVNHGHMKYVGYNRKNGIHKILTYGNPAYIEVIAPSHFPAVFKYPGAVDPKTKVLSSKRTTGVIRLISGNITADGPSMSKQTMYILKDLNMKNGQLRYFTLDSCDLSASSSSKTYKFIENGGYAKNKVYHSSYPPYVAHETPVDKYAEIGITYSVNVNSGDASSFEAKLYVSEKGSSTETQLSPTTNKVLDGRDYKCFQRSYFEHRYNLVGKLTKADTDYKPRMVIGNTVFKSMPYLKRSEIDIEETERKAKKETEKFSYVNWKPEGANDFGISLLGDVGQINFKADALPGYSFSIVPTVDVIRGIYEVDFFLSCGTSEDKDAQGNDTRSKRMRDRQKNVMQPSRFKIAKADQGNWGYDAIGNNPVYNGNDFSSKPDTASIKKKNKWFMNELDDIFKVENNLLGAGPYVKMNLGFGFNFGKKNLVSPIYLKSLEGTIGLGAFAAYSSDWTHKIYEFIGWNADNMSKKIPIRLIFHANASAYVQGTLGLKTYNFLNDNNEIYFRQYGFFFTFEATAKAGAGVMVKTSFGQSEPSEKDSNSSNLTRMFKAQAGGRAGVKASFKYGLVWPFEKRLDNGGTFLVMGAAEIYYDVQLLMLTRIRGRKAGKIGRYFYLPDAANNPMIPSYPNYKGPNKVPALGPSMAPRWPSLTRRSLTPRLAASHRAEDAEGFNFGERLLENVGLSATPFFMGDEHMVLSHQQGASDINDDNMMEFRIQNQGEDVPAAEITLQSGTKLPSDGHRMENLQADKLGEEGIVVYEEMSRNITAEEQASATPLITDTELSHFKRITANHRESNGQWTRRVIAYDESVVDIEPVAALGVNVTSQGANSSGKAACVWKRGHYNVPEDTRYHTLAYRSFAGDLMLSVFDGEQWSAPESIMKLSEEDIVRNYQVIMSNDTVLTVVNLMPKDSEDMQLRYLCKPLGKPLLPATVDHNVPEDFSLDMIGENPYIGILHKVDSLSNDIYVKEINMRGQYTGYGVDLDIWQYNPQSVRLVSDKNLRYVHDFAVVWKKQGNGIRQGGNVLLTDDEQTMLNCSRIFMNENLQATPHITIASTLDTLRLNSYDVYMDNMKISALYTLGDDSNKESYLMRNTVDFYEDFNYTLTYSQLSMIGSETMPVTVNVYNTGTTPIVAVNGYINNQKFEVSDLFISPFSNKAITVNYTLPQNFDGFLKAHDLTATFEDLSTITKAPHRSATRRTKAADYSRTELSPGICDIECRLLSHTVEGTKNTVYVEIVDHSDTPWNENHSLHVGLYPNNVADVPISSSAEVILHGSDFEWIGGERKAYVELTVEGLEEETDAYLRADVYNDRIAEKLTGEADNPLDALVANISGSDDRYVLELLPSELDETTGLPVTTVKDNGHKVKVTAQASGVWISGLEQGDFVRIFDASAMPVYQNSTPQSRIFVPLEQHGVYLLSTGQEIFKFTF